MASITHGYDYHDIVDLIRKIILKSAKKISRCLLKAPIFYLDRRLFTSSQNPTM